MNEVHELSSEQLVPIKVEEDSDQFPLPPKFREVDDFGNPLLSPLGADSADFIGNEETSFYGADSRNPFQSGKEDDADSHLCFQNNVNQVSAPYGENYSAHVDSEYYHGIRMSGALRRDFSTGPDSLCSKSRYAPYQFGSFGPLGNKQPGMFQNPLKPASFGMPWGEDNALYSEDGDFARVNSTDVFSRASSSFTQFEKSVFHMPVSGPSLFQTATEQQKSRDRVCELASSNGNYNFPYEVEAECIPKNDPVMCTSELRAFTASSDSVETSVLDITSADSKRPSSLSNRELESMSESCQLSKCNNISLGKQTSNEVSGGSHGKVTFTDCQVPPYNTTSSATKKASTFRPVFKKPKRNCAETNLKAEVTEHQAVSKDTTFYETRHKRINTEVPDLPSSGNSEPEVDDQKTEEVEMHVDDTVYDKAAESVEHSKETLSAVSNSQKVKLVYSTKKVKNTCTKPREPSKNKEKVKVPLPKIMTQSMTVFSLSHIVSVNAFRQKFPWIFSKQAIKTSVDPNDVTESQPYDVASNQSDGAVNIPNINLTEANKSDKASLKNSVSTGKTESDDCRKNFKKPQKINLLHKANLQSISKGPSPHTVPDMAVGSSSSPEEESGVSAAVGDDNSQPVVPSEKERGPKHCTKSVSRKTRRVPSTFNQHTTTFSTSSVGDSEGSDKTIRGSESSPNSVRKESCTIKGRPKHSRESLKFLQTKAKVNKAKSVAEGLFGKITDKKKRASDTKSAPKRKVLSCSERKEANELTTSKKQQMFELQSKTNAPVWVQCDDCNKWRVLELMYDPSALPAFWTCEQNPDKKANQCSYPEVEYDQSEHDRNFTFNQFTLGSVVWVTGFSSSPWPAMVDDDPDTETFFWLPMYSNYPNYYHVTFFGRPVSRAWAKASQVTKYYHSEPPVKKAKTRGDADDLKTAIEEANEAVLYDLEERRKKFCFAARYKGRWRVKSRSRK